MGCSASQPGTSIFLIRPDLPYATPYRVTSEQQLRHHEPVTGPEVLTAEEVMSSSVHGLERPRSFHSVGEGLPVAEESAHHGLSAFSMVPQVWLSTSFFNHHACT